MWNNIYIYNHQDPPPFRSLSYLSFPSFFHSSSSSIKIILVPSTILLGRDDTTRVNDAGNIPAQRQQHTKPEFDPTPKLPKDSQRGNEVRTK